MGNEHQQSYSFLTHIQAHLHFAKLDASLKAGVHLNRGLREHIPLIAFIEDGNFDSLNRYYQNLFGLTLQIAGETPDTFYYLDYKESDQKGQVVFKDRLASHILVIAIMMWFLHQKGEKINSITDFISALKGRYLMYESTFCRMITNNKTTDTTEIQHYESDGMISVLNSATTQFKNLSWLYYPYKDDKEHFIISPAFKRIEITYAHILNNIDRINVEYQESIQTISNESIEQNN